MSCSGRGRPLRDGTSPLNSVFGRRYGVATGGLTTLRLALVRSRASRGLQARVGGSASVSATISVQIRHGSSGLGSRFQALV
jgi:hypothetical protein